tara:strand:+ start:399 stop:617 length:219 start_codon:yes stop_codon:yes gene_type:complete
MKAPLPKVTVQPLFDLFLNDDKFVTFSTDTIKGCKKMAKKLGKPCTIYSVITDGLGRSNYIPVWSTTKGVLS